MEGNKPNKMSRRRFLQGVTIAGGGALLAACAPVSVPVAGEPAAETIVDTTPEVSPTSVAGPVYGGTLKIGMFQEDQSMDPHDLTGWVGAQISRAIFDPLVDLDPVTCEVIPGLAESWEISEDRTQLTWNLRQGVKFHDGTDFNAEALKWNFDRLRDPESTLTGSGGGTFGRNWTNIEVLDSHRLRITTGPDEEGNPTTFIDPMPDLPEYEFYVVSPAAVEEWGDAFGEHPVGTGPFKFVKWERGTEAVVERNPDYWREGLPYVDEVIFKFIVDDTVRTLSLKTGDIDIMPFTPAKDAAELVAEPQLDVLRGVGGYFGLMFNTAIPPFDNLANREAVIYAMDYNAINEVGYFGMGTLTNGLPVPNVSPWYDASYPAPETDLEIAKQKLAEAGNPDGFEFKTVVPPNPNHRLVLEVIQSNLLPLGIKMEVEQMDRGRYGEILRTDRNYANASWIGHGIYSNWEQYRGQYYSESATNFSNWNNAEADKITDLSEALIGIDDEKRMEYAKQWYELVLRDRPVIPFIYFPQLQAYNTRVQDFNYHCLGQLAWRWVWLMPESA